MTGPAEIRVTNKEADYSYQALATMPLPALYMRCALVRLFNKRLSLVLDMLDMGADTANEESSSAGRTGEGISAAQMAELLRQVLLPLVGTAAGSATSTPAVSSSSASSGGAASTSADLATFALDAPAASSSGAGADASAALLDGSGAFDPSAIAAGCVPLGTLVRSCGHVVFSELKTRILQAALSLTQANTHRPSITLDNMLAMHSADAGTRDIVTSQCIFMQTYRLASRMPRSSMDLLFRSPTDDRGRFFSVQYSGESGIDAGGVSRDALTGAIDDLFSDRLDLFIPVPNAKIAAREGDGGASAAAAVSGGSASMNDTGKFVPNPKYARSAGLSQRARPIFEFVGSLMGFSLRTKYMLPFEFPAIVWKGLTGQAYALEDLEAVDAPSAALIKKVAAWQPPAGKALDSRAASEAFAETFPGLTFTATAADGEVVPLVSGGAGITVTPSNRTLWLSLFSQYQFAQYDEGIEALREGLYAVVPARAIRLLSWQELDVAVAGRPEIDVDVMRANTDFQGFSDSSVTATLFWKVMESLSQQERSLFIRFVWGRSRVPSQRWPVRMKIARLHGSEEQLPIAHTCFFSVELPAYTNEAKMRHKILTAIYFSGGILNA